MWEDCDLVKSMCKYEPNNLRQKLEVAATGEGNPLHTHVVVSVDLLQLGM